MLPLAGHHLGILPPTVSARGHTTESPACSHTLAGPHSWPAPPEFLSGHCRSSSHTQKASHTMAAIAAVAPPQQEDTHGPYTGYPWSTQLWWLDRIALETHKTSSEKCYFSRLEKQMIYKKTQRTCKLMKTSSQHHLSLGRCKIKNNNDIVVLI